MPLGSEAVETESAGPIVRVNGALAFALELSVTCTVKFEGPADDGVPLIRPAELSASPAGSEPAVTVQAYPPVPPPADRVCEYAVPATPLGSDVVVMVSPAPTVRVRGALALALELSVTCTVKLDAPAADGVPLIVPDELKESPAGNVPPLTAHVYPPLPPLADRVCE